MWGDLCGPNIITNVLPSGGLLALVRGRCGSGKRHRVVAVLLALVLEEGATSQGMQVVSKSWKRQWMDSRLECPEGTQLG